MTDAERIALVERFQIDVWYGSPRHEDGFTAPEGWVADLGDPDASLWLAGGEGGSSLAVGCPSWRTAVDAASEKLNALGML